MKKKVLSCCLLMILLLFYLLTACKGAKGYKVDYPDYYTPEYCYENYIDADPNLIHLFCSENSIGTYRNTGFFDTYYAIKDVLLDEYLCIRRINVLFNTGIGDVQIVRNKKTGLSEQEILTLNYKSVELYWQGRESPPNSKTWFSIGSNKVQETIASLSGTDAANFQSHIVRVLESGKCEEVGSPFYRFVTKEPEGNLLFIRVVFEEYENLVWETAIRESDGKYYMYFYWYTADEDHPEGFWDIIYVPLSEEISELIPKT